MKKELGLTEDHARIKRDVTRKVMTTIFSSIRDNLPHYKTNEQMLDGLFSIIVMINRDLLTHLIAATNNEAHVKRLLKELFRAITDEVNRKVNERLQKESH